MPKKSDTITATVLMIFMLFILVGAASVLSYLTIKKVGILPELLGILALCSVIVYWGISIVIDGVKEWRRSPS